MAKKLNKKAATAAFVGLLSMGGLSACMDNGHHAKGSCGGKAGAKEANGCGGKNSCKGKGGCKSHGNCGGK